MENNRGEEVVIKGVLFRNDSSGDIYESKTETKSPKFDAQKYINTETASQTAQTTFQAVVSQAQSMGASGLVAMGSGFYFQVDAINTNTREAISVAKPMFQELVETGTIVPPEGSKFEAVTIPVTESFFGKAVGEAKKRQDAYDKLTPEQKALQDEFIKSTRPPQPTKDPTGSRI